MPATLLNRLLKLSLTKSLFLFGPRNSGKSTLIAQTYPIEERLIIDLLNEENVARFSRNPDDLYEIVKSQPSIIKYIELDEIQRVRRLLNVVHRLMADESRLFIMSGSSARKLKMGGANLLAGRAFVYHLHPYSYLELGEQFQLNEALQWGMLPQIFEHSDPQDKIAFLQAYAQTYLREEIWGELLVRNLDPFRYFLEVAAQSNGKIINISNIADDVGIDDKTVKNYYSILEDTLVGFFLHPHHNSFRKRLSTKPKFYLFDTGITRGLTRQLSAPLMPGTSAYGEAFEHFVILEIIKLSSYFTSEFRFSYIRTKDDVEVDLVIERPNLPLLCIEIKSSTAISSKDFSSFIRLTKDIPNSEALILSQDPYPRNVAHALALHWKEGIKKIFESYLGI